VNDLVDRLVDAYRPYALRRCTELGWERSDRLLASLDEGETWLREALSTLLELPFDQQRRGPLEVFQEAMRFPTAALAAAGVERPARDEAAVRALPGDVYDLAPASTRLLGDEAWAAHMAWGAQKAAAVTRPLVLIATRNLIDRSRIEAAAEESFFRVAKWNGSASGAVLVCVDLELEGALAIIEAAAAENVPVVAYGPHRSTDLLEAARNAGAMALARSAFFGRLDARARNSDRRT
jgi:hypothetical protein